MIISMKLVYQFLAILFNFYTTSNHLHHYKLRIATAIRDLLWMNMTMVNSGLKRLRHVHNTLLIHSLTHDTDR